MTLSDEMLQLSQQLAEAYDARMATVLGIRTGAETFRMKRMPPVYGC